MKSSTLRSLAVGLVVTCFGAEPALGQNFPKFHTHDVYSQEFLAGSWLVQPLDYNDDSYIDLLVTFSSGYRIYIGNSDGSYDLDPAWTSTLAGTTVGDVADFNDDGRMDLLMGGVVTIVDPGALTYWTPLSTAASTTIAADMNNDQKPDVVCTRKNGALSDVRVGLNSGTDIALTTLLPGIEHSEGLCVGDFDGDGNPDVAVGSEGASTAVVLRYAGDGLGGLDPLPPLDIGEGYVAGLASADIVGDSRAEILVALKPEDGGYYTYPVISSILVLDGDTGVVLLTLDEGLADQEIQEVRVLDLDGDGANEIVALSGNHLGGGYNAGPRSTMTWYETTSGSFALQGQTQRPPADSVVIADLDGNGFLDMASVDLGLKNLDVVHDLGVFGWELPEIAIPQVQPRWTAAADFNEDGRTDFMVLGSCPGLGCPGNYLTLISSPAGGYDETPFLLNGVHLSSVFTGDFDGNSHEDAVCAVSDGVGDLFLYHFSGDGTGALSLGATSPIPFGIRSADVADVNGDGNLDLLAHYTDYDDVTGVGAFYGDGTGSFPLFESLWTEDPDNGILIHSTDLNGDSFLDALVSRMDAPALREVQQYFGSATGWIPGPILTDTHAGPIAAADLDGNGLEDFLTGSNEEVLVFLQVATGVFELNQTFSVERNGALTFQDLDGDGDLDLVATARGRSELFKWEAGEFSFVQIIGSGLGASSAAIEDVDYDGDLDLIFLAGPGGIVLIKSTTDSEFTRGDVNQDGATDLSDAIEALGYLFGGTSSDCPAAIDVNDDSLADISDPVFLLAYLFQSASPAPVAPSDCGPDPTPSGPSCDSFPGCL